MIVAASARGVIGNAGGMPWRLHADLRRFKSLTMGHAIILGRKTYASIGKPLPGRRMIVVTRGAALPGGPPPPGVVTVGSLDAAIAEAARTEREEAFVAGGAEIYALAWPRVERIYLTRVDGEISGDTIVPALDCLRFPGGVPPGFVEIGDPESLEDPRDSHRATFHVYEKLGAEDRGDAHGR